MGIRIVCDRCGAEGIANEYQRITDDVLGEISSSNVIAPVRWSRRYGQRTIIGTQILTICPVCQRAEDEDNDKREKLAAIGIIKP